MLKHGKQRISTAIYAAVVLLTFINSSSTFVNASHFRGGTASWQPSLDYSSTNREIRITYNLGWRISYNSIQCTQELIDAKTVINGLGSWVMEGSDIGIASFICQEQKDSEDWMIGYNNIDVIAPASNPFYMWYEGRCWMNTLYNPGCGWNLTMMAFVGERSDTNDANHSPKSRTNPIFRLHLGCPITSKIPITDEDGDSVSCRFAETARECGEKCSRIPYFSLSEETCELTYNGDGQELQYAITLIIEDRPKNTITITDDSGTTEFTPSDVLSYIPLQFIIKLEKLDEACTLKPTFLGPTPPDDQTISATIGKELLIPLRGKSATLLSNVTGFSLVSPFGFNRTEMLELPNKEYQINLSWTPTATQTGKNIVCFAVEDSTYLSSVQRCIVILVGGATSPCGINNGGCSDICTTLESTYQCSCARDCWELWTDSRTCIPKLSVDCGSSSMTINLEKCATVDNKYSLTDTQPSDPTCNVQEDEDSYQYSFSFGDCNTEIQETFWEVIYKSSVRLWGEAPADVGTVSIITRGAWYTVPVTCSLNKFGNLTQSFKPIDRSISLIPVPGMGSFSFFMDLFNNTFETSISPYDFPLKFEVNSDIFFSLRAVGGSAGMELFTVECFARPADASADTSNRYTFVENGCLLDPTIQTYDSPTLMEKRFSIKAFKFRDTFENAPVVIQCRVMVCYDNPETEEVTRCSQGCLADETPPAARRRRDVIVRNMIESPSRKRRQLQQDDDDEAPVVSINVTESPVQQVRSIGDIQILIELPAPPTTGGGGDNNGGDGEDLSKNVSILVIVSACVGGIALLLLLSVVAIIVYHNKYIQPRNAVLPMGAGEGNGGMAYVRDIYVSSIDLHHPGAVKDPMHDFVWARRVIGNPPSRIIATNKHTW